MENFNDLLQQTTVSKTRIFSSTVLLLIFLSTLNKVLATYIKTQHTSAD
jgi:hypothetical protein